MVAARAPQPLPLLLPPDPPTGEEDFRSVGWRWRNGMLRRHPADDVHGAEVQWMVLRYFRDGVRRKELAFEYGYSERTVQSYLSGRESWSRAYGAPVRRALAMMGIPIVRWRTTVRRTDAEIAAGRAALVRAAALLANDPRDEARQMVRAAQLLTINEVPHGR